MLIINIPANEFYDESTESFIYFSSREIRLEHSLVSISKWESKWHKPFLSSDDKTNEQLIDYIRMMTITQNVDDLVYSSMSQKTINEITEYINNPMTATTFSDRNNRPSREIITAEIIYYWMVSLQIPFECQKWHLNRLLTLVKVCSIKSNPKQKKMSKAEIFRRNRELNAQRKSRLGTTG